MGIRVVERSGSAGQGPVVGLCANGLDREGGGEGRCGSENRVLSDGRGRRAEALELAMFGQFRSFSCLLLKWES